MLYQSYWKKVIEKYTGYWIYKKKHLPTGMDPFADIENYFLKKEDLVVFDIGANNGQTALVLNSRLNNPLIYCFEPDNNTFKQLIRNTQKIKSVHSYQVGLGEKERIMKLYRGKFSEWNSFVEDLNDPENYLEVEVITLDSFIKKNNIQKIDFLKTDTEGFDLNVLAGAKEALKNRQINFIYSEAGFYQENKRNTNFYELVEFLNHYNYKLFSVYHVAKCGTYMANGNAMFINEDLIKNI